MQASVARCPRTPPIRANELELSFGFCYRLSSNSYRSIIVICNYTVCADNGGHPAEQKLTPLNVRRSYFGPISFVVEPPGTAPGSDPPITCAFITIAVKQHLYYDLYFFFLQEFFTKLPRLAWISTALVEEEDFQLVIIQLKYCRVIL